MLEELEETLASLLATSVINSTKLLPLYYSKHVIGKDTYPPNFPYSCMTTDMQVRIPALNTDRHPYSDSWSLL
jgi:hypothetical protein